MLTDYPLFHLPTMVGVFCHCMNCQDSPGQDPNPDR